MGFRSNLLYLNLSKAEFARQIGVTPDTVSRWGDDPPKLVRLYIRERLARRDFARRVLSAADDELNMWLDGPKMKEGV